MIDSANLILEEYQHRKTRLYSGRNTAIDTHERLVDQDVDCKQPPGEPKHVPPDALREMKKAVNQIYSPFHSRTFRPDKLQTQKENFDTFNKVLDASIQDNDDRNESNIGRELCWDLAMGYAALKGPFFDVDLLNAGETPIVFYPVDNRCVFPGVNEEDVIFGYERFAGEIEETVRKWNEKHTEREVYDTAWIGNAKFAGRYDKILWIEYYTPTQRCFIVGNNDEAHQVSGIQDNPLGFVPLCDSYSGWGRGKSLGDPTKRAIGRLKGMESSIEAYARSITALNILLRYYSYGRYVGDERFVEYFKNMGQHPAQITPVPKEAMPSSGGLEQLPQNNVNQDMYAYVAMAKKDMEGLGGNEALSGSGPGDESGVKAMYRIRQSAIDLQPPREAFERIYSKLETNTLKLLTRDWIKEDKIDFGGTELKISSIPKNIRVVFKQIVRDPQEDNERLRMGMDLWDRQLILLEEFRKDYYRDADFANFVPKYLAENTVLTSPQLRESMAMRFLTDSGRENEAAMVGGQTRPMTQGNGQAMPMRTERKRQTLVGPQGMGGVDTRGMPGMGGQVG